MNETINKEQGYAELLSIIEDTRRYVDETMQISSAKIHDKNITDLDRVSVEQAKHIKADIDDLLFLLKRDFGKIE